MYSFALSLFFVGSLFFSSLLSATFHQSGDYTATSHGQGDFYGAHPHGINSSSITACSPMVCAMLCYLFCWLGALIVLLLERKNLFTLFHAWQGLAAGTFLFILQLVGPRFL